MNPTLYALLIGIDYYFPNNINEAKQYPRLRGCVHDIECVEGLLIHKMNMRQENIIKLTSSKANYSDKPSESPEIWPTYKNIVAALYNIITIAQPGDQVYIHYSGNGGRIKSLLPEIKGKDGLDNILVPVSIDTNETRYLRDIEIIKILKEMLDKKLVVTLILDTNYYGRTIRGRAGADIRSINVVDNSFHPKDSLVASLEELASAWNILTSQKPQTAPTKIKVKSRDITHGSGWLPNPRNYVLITACKSSESAYEYIFEGDQRNGVLTYWLIKSLEQLAKPVTYKVLHNSIVAKVHSQFPMQTPMLEGEGDREVFGSNTMQAIYVIDVIRLDLANQKVLLNAGQAHGVRKGMRFAIYPSGVDFSRFDKRLALVQVDESESTNSWAKIIAEFTKGSMEKGSQAVLINPLDVHIKRKLRLVYGSNKRKALPSTDLSKTQEQALDKIKSAILNKSKKSDMIFLELASDDDDKADFQLTINKKGEYEIWDPAGNAIPNLNPPLMINDSGSVSKIIQRLEHLTKYSNIQLIDNLDVASELSRKLVVELELFEVPDDYERGDRLSDLQPIAAEGNTKIAEVGQKLILRIRNTSKKVLNVTILDLQPDWGVSQIYPSGTGAYSIPIDPGHEELFPLQVDLPSDYKEGKDVIKVFAALDKTNFRWLELPSLDQAFLDRQYETRFKQRRFSLNTLETFMANMIGGSVSAHNIRNLGTVETTKTTDWTSGQIEIQINRVTTKASTVLISYAREDLEQARKLYRDLKSSGLNPWLDMEDLMPGQNWKHSIKEAIKNSEYFIPLFSINSVAKRGFVQKELREALDFLEELPESKIHVIPVRLNECIIPYEQLRKIEAVDLFPNWKKGIKRILSSIN